MSNDNQGDRMKFFEKNNINSTFPNGVPVVARIDGRSFSKFTKGLRRPYDEDMSKCMQETARHLVEHTGACISYQQSDEITLVWYNTNYKSEIWFGGKMQKMVSQLAAQATLAFYRQAVDRLPEGYAEKLPTFDARVWWVPSLDEACNAVLWRVRDAVKNSISMAAYDNFSTKQLHKKNGNEMQEMLFAEKDINWNDYPAFFKRGVFYRRIKTQKALTDLELEELPPLHHARLNPEMLVERSSVVYDDTDFSKVEDKVKFLLGIDNDEKSD